MYPLIVFLGFGLLFWTIAIHLVPYEYISDIHAGISFVLSVITVLRLIPDYILFSWSMTYFMVDLIELIIQWDVTYIIHHTLSIIVPIAGLFDPVLTLGTNAGAYIMLIEYSTVILNHWQRNRNNKNTYFELLIVYFVNRIVYLTYLLYFSFISRPKNKYGYFAVSCLRILHVLMFV
ncbi:putative membrane protein, partial [Emiliania huxleyi virus 145]